MKQLTKSTFQILKGCGCLGNGKVLRNKNNRDMKNVNDEEEPLTNSAIAFQEPDETEIFLNDNEEETIEETEEQPLLYNEAIGFERKYADAAPEAEEPLAFNGNELK